MRENSGKGDSNTNLRDPTLKEHEAARGKSGEALLNEKEKEGSVAHGGDVAGPASDEPGKRQSPAGGPPDKH